MSNLKERLHLKLRRGNVAQGGAPDINSILEDSKSRAELLQRYVKECMTEGQDYGLIPGCQKPSLLKPGAEKLCELFQLSKLVEVVYRNEDWTNGVFSYEVKASLANSKGVVVAEGVGSCNSKEKEYVDKNAYDLVNTLLKMSEKRAVIDAALSATRSSLLFTQDMEDMPTGGTQNNGQPQNPSTPQGNQQSRPSNFRQQSSSQGNHPSNAPANNQNNGGRPANPITEKQLAYLLRLLGEKHLTTDQTRQYLVNRYKLNNCNNLTSKQASDFIDFLKGI